MGWTISTYAGTRATGSPSNYRTAMFELCRAVKERSAAINGTGTSSVNFVKTDGTSTTSPTMADLYLLPCSGPPANNYAKANLGIIRNFITGTLAGGKWMTSDGGPTAYSVASMESAIGASLDVPTKVNEARAWQAYQDALDRMIYVYSELTPPTTILSQRKGYTSDLYGTVQGAWDNRTDNTNFGGGSPGGLLEPAVWWSAAGGPSTYSTGIRHTVTSVKMTLGISSTAATLLGVLTSAHYVYTSSFSNTSVSSFSVDYDGDTITTTGSETSTSTATPTMGAPIVSDLAISTSEPSTVPFSFSSGSSGHVGLQLRELNIYHNLETILTDQAA